MYILESTMFKRTLISLGTVAFLTACSADVPVNDTQKHNTNSDEVAVDGAVAYKVIDGKYTQYHVNTDAIGQKYGFGRTPTQTEVKAWDIDVMPYDEASTPMYDMKHGKVVLEDGEPKKAEGSVEWGNELYDAQCAMCHGDFGAGGSGYPALSGGDGTTKSLTLQLMNPADAEPGMEPPKKVIGTYWPYASTLFWYIQDAMPFPHPKSLSNSETYAITAYLLMENGVKFEGEPIDEEFVLDKEKMLKIKLANAEGFYPKVDTPDNPHQGVENMKKYLSDPKNYGAGERCMTDCIKEPVEKLVMRIDQELNDFNPPASTERSLPVVVETGDVHPGKAGYEANGCGGCHDNAAIGAPVVGDKDAWITTMEKGLDAVYSNGINGINAMPPKGGAGITDDEFKLIVDYMIEASK